MKIKAISLWQPWASLIWTGAKTYETRSWPTSYQGPLLICAAKFKMEDLTDYLMDPDFERGLKPLWDSGAEELPFGQALCIVDLVGCIPVERFDVSPNYLELVELHMMPHRFDMLGDDIFFGNFLPGRFAWKLTNLRRLERYYPVKGHQGLWDQEIPFDLDGHYIEQPSAACTR